ncbi:hypothetical protein ABTL16_19300, partial [Acinetobacter baumannii]
RPTLAWLSEDALIALAAAGTTPPWVIRRDSEDQARLARLWQDQRAGKVATVTSIGSGRYVSVTPPAAPVTLVRLDVATGAAKGLAKGDFET